VRIRQETDYPTSGAVAVHVDPDSAAEFPLSLRIPRWCAKAALTVNGKSVVVKGPGFATIRRKWKAGDRVELRMEMPWRLVRGRQAQEGKVAVMRGPLVYCFNPLRNPDAPKADALTLDPARIASVRRDDSLRPNGSACEIALGEGRKLVLTEYHDPGGQAIYFQAAKDAKTVTDELVEG